MELKRLGKYEIVSKIGQGAMGEVFKAHDPILGRDVAVKTMSATIGADDELRRRFHREAQSAARLNHPNIITVFDFGEEQGRIYMAMELLEGTDLKDMIGRHAPMSLDQKLTLMEQICDGLAFAHAKEVVHRDLKPANIHIQQNGQVKIMDFGLARLASSADMTKAGMIMGTPNYMSPEQVRGEKADSRSDVFSLGAVFYELVAGRKPFDADSLHAVLFQVLQSEPEPLASLVPAAPAPLVQAIERAMSKDHGHRFRDAAEMREALREVRASIATQGTILTAELPELPRADATILTPAAKSHPPVAAPPPRRPPPRPAPASASLPGPLPPPPASWPPAARPSASHPPAPGPVVARPPAPQPPAPPVDGATALDAGRGSPDSQWPRMPGTLSGQAPTVTPAGAAAPAMSSGSYPGVPPAAVPAHAGEPRRGGPPIPLLLAGAGVLALAATLVIAYRVISSRPAASPAPSPTAAASADTGELSALTQQLLASQIELARKNLDDKDYRAAEQQARRVLEKDADNAAARNILTRSQAAMRDVEEAVRQGRQALDAGDTRVAARSLEKILAMDPKNPVAAEFSQRLNGVFRGQAEEAQQAMRASQQQALKARAGNQNEFAAAAASGRDAEGLFAKAEFAGAARKFLEARDGYERARRAAERPAPSPVVVASAAPPPTLPAPPSAAPATTLPAVTTPPATLAGTSLDEQAIRRLVADYGRAIETRDLELFRSLKPNLSGSEARAVKGSASKSVRINVAAIDVQGNRATVMVSRKDAAADGKEYFFQQTLVLQKEGRAWTIRNIAIQQINK